MRPMHETHPLRLDPPRPTADETGSTSAVSLLVGALAALQHPCARNRTAACLLLERVAHHDSLTAAERDLCRTLADELDASRQPLAFATGWPATPATPEAA